MTWEQERSRGMLAANMVPVAAEFACLVRDEDRTAVEAFLARLSPAKQGILLVVLAAMVPVDSTPEELLSWVTWDEHGKPLEGVKAAPAPKPVKISDPKAARAPQPVTITDPIVDIDLRPCGTYAAYRRHCDRGEPVDEACRTAVRNYWTTRQRRKRGTRTA